MWPPATKDQLLCLDEEFNRANAAAPQFEIMPRDSDFRMTAHSMDLPLHRMNVSDGGKIKIFAPDKGRKIFEKVDA